MTDWEQRLASAGHRITQPRRAIVRVLEEMPIPLAPQEILRKARAYCPDVGLVTVYRTLNLLAEMNLVRRIHQDEGCHAYAAASPGHRHALICRRCERTIEFAGGCDLDALIREIEAKTGYHVEDHLLQLFGLCPECSESERRQNGPDLLCGGTS